MNKLIAISLFCLASIGMKAQSNNGPFRAYLYNNEFDVYLRINFYDQNVRVPGQDLFGVMRDHCSNDQADRDG